MKTSADFSACRTYRYSLWRIWDASVPYATFIGLNPSTADETVNDRTINRCISFAKDWEYGGLCMANLFAFRHTKPAMMRKAADPVGPDNDKWLDQLVAGAGIVVAAWGTHGTFRQRDQEVRERFRGVLHYLRLTKEGHPEHPLYLPGELRPKLWRV